MRKFIVAFFILLAANVMMGRTTSIVYIQGKDENHDAGVISDLNMIRDGLNYQNNSHGSYYEVKIVTNFADAKKYIAETHPTVSIAVFHGVFTASGSYTGDVSQKIGDQVPEGSVRPIGNSDVFCGKDGKVPVSTVIDRAIYHTPDDSYPSSGGTNNGGGGGSGGGGSGGGHWVTVTWQEWVYSTAPNGHLQGILTTFTTTVFVPDNTRPKNALA